MRPVRYFEGVPSPVKHPDKVDYVIFRENTEDVYSGVEFKRGSKEANALIAWLNKGPLKKLNKSVRLDSGVGVKPMSVFGCKRLIRAALEFAVANKKKSRDHDAQGQHHEVHRRRVS